MRETFVSTLLEEAKKDKNIILVTGDLGYKLFDDFYEYCPSQIINLGINEQSMMGAAAGLASTGKRVFVYSIANFPTLRCLEQIRNDICYMKNPVVIVSVGAGLEYGSLGYSHHAVEDIAVLRSLPNLDLLSPCDTYETKSLTQMLANNNHPSYLRLSKSSRFVAHKNPVDVRYGKFLELTSGSDGYVFFTGTIGKIALEARSILLGQGVSITVVSIPFINRLDHEYLLDIDDKKPIVVLEEHMLKGGLGSAMLEDFNELGIKGKIEHFAIKELDLELNGSGEFLQKEYGLSVDNLVNYFLKR